MVDVTCKCGKVFRVLECRIRTGGGKFCSRECASSAKPRFMKNRYEINGDIAILFISSPIGELKCLIDAADIEKLITLGYTWSGRKDYRKDHYYVSTSVKVEYGVRRSLPLHRFIMDPPSNKQVDHINGNTLDNRKINLRIVTIAENGQNKIGTAVNSTSGVRGVSWHKFAKKWIASLTVNQRRIHVGYFDNIDEAKLAISEARAKHMPFSENDKAM